MSRQSSIGEASGFKLCWLSRLLFIKYLRASRSVRTNSLERKRNPQTQIRKVKRYCEDQQALLFDKHLILSSYHLTVSGETKMNILCSQRLSLRPIFHPHLLQFRNKLNTCSDQICGDLCLLFPSPIAGNPVPLSSGTPYRTISVSSAPLPSVVI